MFQYRVTSETSRMAHGRYDSKGVIVSSTIADLGKVGGLGGRTAALERPLSSIEREGFASGADEVSLVDSPDA